MKRLILIFACSIALQANADPCGLNSFARLYGANSPIFNLPLYYSDQHFEYDQVRHCQRIADNCTTKKSIIKSKVCAPAPKKIVPQNSCQNK